MSAAGAGVRRRRRDIDSKYLLSGFARCAQCGGTMSVDQSQPRRSSGCSFTGVSPHAKRGEDRVRQRARPAHRARRRCGPREAQSRRAAPGRRQRASSRACSRRCNRRRPRRTSARCEGTAGAGQQDREPDRGHRGRGGGGAARRETARASAAEREALLTSIAATEAVEQQRVDRHEVERRVLAQVEHWRELLGSQSRQALREALDGPIEFVPEGKQYRFRGKTTTGQLITSLVISSTLSGVPNGDCTQTRSGFARFTGPRAAACGVRGPVLGSALSPAPNASAEQPGYPGGAASSARAPAPPPGTGK